MNKPDPRNLGIPNINFSLPIEDERQNKWSSQRRERGFDDTELFNLDNTIVLFILPRLIAFRNQTVGYPMTFNTLEEWKQQLTKMIIAFDLYKEWDVPTPEQEAQIKEGLDLFHKHFGNLWW